MLFKVLMQLCAASIMWVLLLSTTTQIVHGLPVPNADYPIYSERRSVFFTDQMTVFPQDKNITLTVLHNILLPPQWLLLKDGFDVFQHDRIKTVRNTTTFTCVTSYDTGTYSFIEIDALNTGYNIQSWTFNLSVIGADSETLHVEREPEYLAMSGASLAPQPIIRWDMLQDGVSRGRIEPFIAKAPPNSSHHYITYEQTTIDLNEKLTTFSGLMIVGEPGDYTIGFVDADTCEIVLLPRPVAIYASWYSLLSTLIISTVISIGILLLGIVIRLILNHRRHNKDASSYVTFLKSFKMSILIKNIDVLLHRRGSDSLHLYFKTLRLFIVLSAILTVLGLALLIPITLRGDNHLGDTYLFTQANWQFSAPSLFVYQVAVVVIFISLIILYTRFNDERVFNLYDRNHLVTSRTVLLTGLPKSIIDGTLLSEFLQTSYSKGIYSLSIILEKHFHRPEITSDLDGFNDGFLKEMSAERSNQSAIKSTGQAFVTFSCVSDKHLFQTQYSPHKWGWAKDISHKIPPQYEAELQTKKWRAYSDVPRVSDIMWTKLHCPSSYNSHSWTVFILIISFMFFMTTSIFAVLLHDLQYERLPISKHITSNMSHDWIDYMVYTFLPCNVLLVLNRIIPCIIKAIFERSRIYVRSSLKYKIMLTTFYAQAISIVGVPTLYYVLLMGFPITSTNVFFFPTNFFRTGVTPFLDSSRIYSSVANLIKFFKYKESYLIDERFLDLSTQYVNVLLMVLMISIYAPMFPPLFILMPLYMVKKYFFDKYTIISSKIVNPPSDKQLVEPLQHCLWMIITCMSLFNLAYAIMIVRFDLLIVYIFLFIIGFGRYVPSCSRSLCYGVCDGAVLPCMDMKHHEEEDNDVELDRSETETDDDEDDEDSLHLSDMDVDGAVEMKDIGGDKQQDKPHNSLLHSFTRMTLNLKQNYAVESSKNIFSFIFNTRYKLPSAKSITVHLYFSPVYCTDRSQFTAQEEEKVEQA
ncbi:hypothetical protein SAMD00019534_048130 [Acytostelium subglobosum LB1]|uniref:hypothetical protein n=1 Tax=Acytostelium subglobosum LB1 TaxID=1410327 RepID=UPI000644F0CB|nr:hypothetical protein SAMD00019534_048130 [Acytostelium subglobosum LB1]GAM21638.1 hypothetical protein SAMD00019534_048130 [Acytostelium subglobosum LB1]|eukprot:XP_012755757.1 hypothetical protein SAMD00019534_048130 [Acytostelium subglobosum LB1]